MRRARRMRLLLEGKFTLTFFFHVERTEPRSPVEGPRIPEQDSLRPIGPDVSRNGYHHKNSAPRSQWHRIPQDLYRSIAWFLDKQSVAQLSLCCRATRTLLPLVCCARFCMSPTTQLVRKPILHDRPLLIPPMVASMIGIYGLAIAERLRFSKLAARFRPLVRNPNPPAAVTERLMDLTRFVLNSPLLLRGRADPAVNWNCICDELDEHWTGDLSQFKEPYGRLWRKLASFGCAPEPYAHGRAFGSYERAMLAAHD